MVWKNAFCVFELVMIIAASICFMDCHFSLKCSGSRRFLWISSMEATLLGDIWLCLQAFAVAMFALSQIQWTMLTTRVVADIEKPELLTSVLFSSTAIQFQKELLQFRIVLVVVLGLIRILMAVGLWRGCSYTLVVVYCAVTFPFFSYRKCHNAKILATLNKSAIVCFLMHWRLFYHT